jgi:hypothetical protein
MMCYVSPMRTLRRLGALVLFLSACAAPPPDPPNLVYILADDLGFGELGSYGQTRIRTPHLDRLAAEGMRFTQHYSGSPVCAPSRATLLTGLHTGHAEIRDNDEMGERGDVWNDPDLEGQRPLSDGARTLGEVLQDRGYVTAAIGKWGLGWVGSEGDPNRQGFDHPSPRATTPIAAATTRWTTSPTTRSGSCASTATSASSSTSPIPCRTSRCRCPTRTCASTPERSTRRRIAETAATCPTRPRAPPTPR